MQTIRYSTIRLFVFVLVGIALGTAGAFVMMNSSGKVSFAGFILLALGAFAIGLGLRYLLTGAAVFCFNSTNLEYAGLTGTKRFKWNDITKFEIWKQKGTRHLYVHTNSGKFSISEMLLEQESRPLERIIQRMEETAAGEHRAPAARAPVPVTPMPQAHAGFGRKGV
jgi:hypothetical protein